LKGGKTIAVTADHGTFLATDDPDEILSASPTAGWSTTPPITRRRGC
jgi:hypothetical protein